jgi:hypothetical protein
VPFGTSTRPIIRSATLADQDLDPDEIDTGADHGRRLVERCLDVRLMERDPEPWPPGLAEHPDGLAADRALGIDALDRGSGQPLRLRLGDEALIALEKQLSLEAEVDRPGCDVGCQLLRVEVVFGRAIAAAGGEPEACGSEASQRSMVAPASGGRRRQPR